MKKIPRSPALEWRVVNYGTHSFPESRSSAPRTLPYDVKKALSPRSLDFMLSVKYRRYVVVK